MDKPLGTIRSALLPWCLLALFAVNDAFAGVGSMLRSITANEATIRVRVVDDSGRVIAGATIWWINDSPGRAFADDVLVRQLRRYQADADFISRTRRPLFDMWVTCTDMSGNSVKELRAGDFGKSKRIRVQFVAFKRGYRTKLKIIDVPVRGHPEFVLQIQRTDEQLDPRMEELDLLRAKEQPQTQADMMSADRQSVLKGLRDRLLLIAAELENEGKPDLAAAYYFYLSDMPSVELQSDEAGHVVVRGYTNGYDPKSPERRAYRERAISLAQSQPQMKYEQLLAEYWHARVFAFTLASKSAERRKYIADTERAIQSYGERTWPEYYEQLWESIAAEQGYDAGCIALRRFFDFEPAYVPPGATWSQRLSLLAEISGHARGDTTTVCSLPFPAAP